MDDFPADLWRDLHPILTLDLVRPFLLLMGVARGSETLIALARETFPDPKQYDSLSDDDLGYHFRQFCSLVERETGTAAAARFRLWLSQVFLGDHNQQPIRSSWDIAFRAWSRNTRLPPEVYPQPRLLTPIRQTFDASSAEDARALFERKRLLRLSNWDLEVLTQRHWFGSTDHPKIEICFAIAMHRFIGAWGQFIEPLPQEAKEELVDRARAVLKFLKVWNPQPLLIGMGNQITSM